MFDNGAAGTLLGGITFRNLWVQVHTLHLQPYSESIAVLPGHCQAALKWGYPAC